MISYYFTGSGVGIDGIDETYHLYNILNLNTMGSFDVFVPKLVDGGYLESRGRQACL